MSLSPWKWHHGMNNMRDTTCLLRAFWQQSRLIWELALLSVNMLHVPGGMLNTVKCYPGYVGTPAYASPSGQGGLLVLLCTLNYII